MYLRSIGRIVSICLWLALAVPLSAADSIIEPPRLWIAEDAGVQALSPEGDLPAIVVPGTSGATAAVVDAAAQQVWIHSAAGLTLLDARGQAIQAWDLPSAPDDPAAPFSGETHLAPVASDGSLWVGQGLQLRAFGPGGQALAEAGGLLGEVLALELDPDRNRLWVATATEVLGLDALTGELQVRIESATSRPVTALATDLASGDLWVGHEQGLLRYRSDGSPVASPEQGPDRVDWLAAARDQEELQGLWVVQGSELVFFDPELHETFRLEVFGPGLDLTSLAVDPSNGVAWVSDGRRLAGVRPGGANEIFHDLGEAARVRSLSVLRVVRLPRPPGVEILRPTEDQVLQESRPEIEIRWTQGDHEVLPETLEVTSSGTELAVECEPVSSGLMCRPVDDLPAGSVFVGASVGDIEALRSEVAVVGFRIEPRAGQPEEVPPASGGDPNADEPGETPTYTPVVSPRGLRPNSPFVVGSELDRVDPSSGNLTLDIPFGQTFEVGPLVKYQIRAVYNAKVWEHHEALCSLSPDGCGAGDSPTMFALTNPQSNAGLGWEVHFGRLYAPVPPAGLPSEDHFRWPNRDGATAQGLRWMYVAPDGATRHLYHLPGRDNGTNDRPVRYSKDGSYLRMVQTSSHQIRIEFPNGLASIFETTSEAAGTNFCGNFGSGSVTGCWRFTRLEDPYGNRMSVSYAVDGTREIWTVSDSTGREHKLIFGTANSGTGGGDCADPGGSFCTQTGDEWGDPRRVLKRIRLAAFGGQQAVYELNTRVAQVSRGCPHDTGLPTFTRKIRLPLLDSIAPPLGQPYSFEYNENLTGDCNPESGTLTKVTLPTGGAFAFEYSNNWQVPTRCSYHNAPDAEASFNTVGVIQRLVLNSGGGVQNDTRYSSQLLPAIPASQLSGPGCQRAKYRVTTVDGPRNGDTNRVRTKTYHAVYAGPRTPSASTAYSEWQVTDTGLPYTKSAAIPSAVSGPLFLSQETFLCGTNLAGDPRTCTKMRSTYLRYTSEYKHCNKASGDGADCFQVDPALVHRMVRYHDDWENGAPHFVETVNAQPDGAGHFRKVTTIDDWDGSSGTTRQVSTDWTGTNATLTIDSSTGYLSGPDPSTYLPSPGSRWILGTYSQQSTWEPPSGRTYVTSTEFDDKGTLVCSRRQRTPSAKSGDDLVVEFVLGAVPGTNAGLPIREIVAGGSGASLPTATACSGGAGSASAGTRFELSHTFVASSLAQTELPGYPTWYRADIDPDTGLPAATYNPQDQKTTHSFDLLGRLTRSVPEASLDGATLAISYHNPVGADAYVIEKQEKGATVYRWQQTFYDHLGRVLVELRKIPRPDGGELVSKRIQQWDPAGLLRRTSTWQNEATFDRDLATYYRVHDAFGRPKEVRAADGWTKRYDYKGDRVAIEKAHVTTADGPVEFWYPTEKDAFGRVIRQREQVDTHFAYDPYGQVIRSWRNDGSATQSRFYTYDARGLLLGESHPELAGLDITTTRDAFGQVRSKSQGSRVLDYRYDNGGRLTSIREPGRVWKEWVWAANNSSGNYRKGKVESATRHNYPFDNSDFPVTETYEYRGRLGQLSRLAVSVGNLHGVTFTQDLAYDPTGQLTTQTYPVCTGPACTDGDDLPAPAHTATTTYQLGFATEVASSRGPWGRFTYHPNFQAASLETRNGVSGSFFQGTNGLPRPQQIRFSRPGQDLYDSGTFAYDARGNITAIGNDIYRYDAGSRLTYATLKRAGNRWETYQQDTFDNIVRAQSDGDINWVEQPVDPATNRALGGHGDVEHDDAGNLIKIGPPSFTMRYDTFDLQAHFHQHVGTEVDELYAYGPGDRRIITFDTLTGEATYHLRGPGGAVLREYRVTGTSTFEHQKDLIHGPGGLLATVSRTGETFYFHKDHLGSPRAVTNTSGTLVGQHDYYPYGREAPNTLQHPETLAKFTGHQRDNHGFSDYMLARTCLWPLRRFATIDPARDGWNLYTYARDNPVKYIDPDGRFSKAEGASVAVSFVPVIGDLKDFQETITGLDLITGETLSPFERGLTGLSAILPIVGGAALRKAVGGADEALSVADDIVSKGKAKFLDKPSQTRHIFRDAPGHLADTPANRELLQGVADDASMTLGTDRFGNVWSAQTLENGTQVWVQTRNGFIQNGGLNPTPRIFNSETGLSAP